MPKNLVVFYSRSGNTKKLAEEIAQLLNCTVEEIIDRKNRKGVLGFIASGREAMKKIPAEIEPARNNPADFDAVIIGTPVWGGTLSSPVRAYILQNKGKFKRIAFFCTKGGEGDHKSFDEMESLCGKKPIATFSLQARELGQEPQRQKTKDFAEEIKKP